MSNTYLCLQKVFPFISCFLNLQGATLLWGSPNSIGSIIVSWPEAIIIVTASTSIIVPLVHKELQIKFERNNLNLNWKVCPLSTSFWSRCCLMPYMMLPYKITGPSTIHQIMSRDTTFVPLSAFKLLAICTCCPFTWHPAPIDTHIWRPYKQPLTLENLSKQSLTRRPNGKSHW